MPIDLSRFITEQEVIMPIIAGWGKAAGRKITTAIEDGWYRVKFPQAEVVRKASPLQIDRTLRNQEYLMGYAMGGEVVTVNFDTFEKRGLGEAVAVNFLNVQPFEVAKVVRWEDDRFYYFEPEVRFQRDLLKAVKEAYEKELPLVAKGITPELRYYFLLLSLQRQSFRQVEEFAKLKLSELERARRIKEFQSTFQGRLQEVIEKAGGELIRYYKANATSYLVQWKIKDSDQVIKSTIQDNFRILDLGYCASGHDKEHSISSAIQLAKLYGEQIYITRD